MAYDYQATTNSLWTAVGGIMTVTAITKEQTDRLLASPNLTIVAMNHVAAAET